MPSHAERRIAVIIRAHLLSPKLTSLIEALAGHDLFDTFVSTNESRGKLEIGPHTKVPFTMETMRDLGFYPQDESFITHCSDLLFEHYRRCLPAYDFYILIEYDVELTRGGGAFLDDLARKLRSPAYRDLDLVGTDVSYRGEGWSHHANAARLFPSVYMVFFPFVGLSQRAIAHLYKLRLAEGARTLPTDDRVFCEAFVASALVNDPTFRTADLNEMFSGAYARNTFYWGLPMLSGGRGPRGVAVEMRHPVFAAGEFLGVHLYHAVATRRLAQYIATLEIADLPIPEDLREKFIAAGCTARGHQRNADWMRAKDEEPSPEPAPIDCPPVVLLVDDADLPVRDPIDAQPRSLVDVASRPLLQHVLDRLASAGCQDVAVCLGPGTDDLSTMLGQAGPGSRETPARAADPLSSAKVASPRIHVVAADGTRTGARVKQASETLGRRRFILAFGETLSDIDLGAVLRFHEQQGKQVTIVATQPDGISLALDGEVPLILDRHPRPGLPWTNAGYMVFEQGACALLENDDAIADGAFLGRLERSGDLAIYEHKGFWQSADTERGVTLLGRLDSAQDAT